MNLGARKYEKLIHHGILWSAVGTFIPLVAAVISIPSLIHAMGEARFGILSLIWVLVGYFGFFDLGIGRALTHLVATRIAAGKNNELAPIIRSGFLLMAGLGVLGGLVMAAAAPLLAYEVLSVPNDMRAETLSALYLLAVSIPVVIVTSGFRGILEGFHRFDLVNLIKAPLGALTYLGPLLVLTFTHELPSVIAILLVGRVLSLLAYAAVCYKVMPVVKEQAGFSKSQIQELLAFGGWLTLSNIAGPLLLYLGRFLLAVYVSAEAVAYFSTPYEVVIALLLLPGIYVSVLFPNFSQRFQFSINDARILYKRWQFYTLISMLPLCVMVFLVARPGLEFWISPEFADHSYRVAQILAIGIFINSFGYISQCLIQAYGRPDLTAKLHVVELVLYFPYLWWLVLNEGIEGAAIAWSIRVTISTAALSMMASFCLNGKIKPNT